MAMLSGRQLSRTENHGGEDDTGPLEWQDERDTPIMTATFPFHPLPNMQAPFEESMLDATGETGHVPYVISKKGVKTRQQMMCREEGAAELSWNFTYNCHWRNYPKGKFHPLRKTITQIVFGVHLLHQHLEKSVADVADILLKHVNELDSFLQRASEDLESSLKDMVFRHKCLKVPMEHVNEFDRLLEDRAYRSQLLDGNIVIERTIGRMSEMVNDYLIDINTFQEANRELDLYLLQVGEAWTYHNEDIGRIYSAMCGNTGGWSHFLQSLVVKAERLGVVLVQVSSYCNEIEKRCGAASRRSMVATRTSSRNSSNSRDNGRGFGTFASNKPLPTTPSERPPFIASPTNGSEVPSDSGIPRRRSQIPHSKLQNQSDMTDSSSSGRETPRVGEASQVPSASSNKDVDARQKRLSTQPEYYHEAWHNEEQRGRSGAQVESHRTSRLFGHRRKVSSQSSKGAEEKAPAFKRLSVKPDSPPLTGKDSAYSSVSGASFSPTAMSPRSGSSISSRNVQFGLFPSRNLSTPPRGSMAGRLGTASPAFGPTLRSVKSDVTPGSSRPQTSMSNVSETPSKKLSKRSSFTSLKRLFTKKRPEGIAPIAE